MQGKGREGRKGPSDNQLERVLSVRGKAPPHPRVRKQALKFS